MVDNYWNLPSWFKGGTSASHGKFRNITFENITINCPLVQEKAQIFSDWDDGIDGVFLNNIYINDELVTIENVHDYFEFTDGQVAQSRVNNVYVQRSVLP